MSGERVEKFVIQESLPGERLDKFVASQCPEVSRVTIQRLISEGYIKVNGQVVKPTYHPRKGDVVEIIWPVARSSDVVPQEIPLKVIYEDDDILVLNKQPGIVVHPGSGVSDNTLVNALLHHCGGSLSGIGGVVRPGIVHRLDRDTSGVMVVAKNDFAHMALAEQFAKRKTFKVYNAIVCGHLEQKIGDIQTYIVRDQIHRHRMSVATHYHKGGRMARTSYTVVEEMFCSSLVEVVIHTGRTHQIRVHFQHLGHPVFGDQIYGVKTNKKLYQLTGYKPERLLLHARRLDFIHPRTMEPESFEAELPNDFRAALRVLRQLAADSHSGDADAQDSIS
ncbi:MAG: RluA family pseudouridine synthase [Verrucomicrobiae bacterium]|nr:RluA family pseudouridine synthase [Verrucomicrobiae bacterium]